MPSEILVKHGIALVWSNSTDYLSYISGLERTHQLDLTGVLTTEARQGDKGDLEHLSIDKFPARWMVSVGIEIGATAPANGETVDFYWSGSSNPVLNHANPGGTSGSDSDYTGVTGSTLSSSLLQLQYIGSLVATAWTGQQIVQYQTIGVLTTIHRYGMPVVVNSTGQSFFTNAAEMYVALIPLIDEAQ